MVPPLIALQDVVQASLRQLTNKIDHTCPLIGQMWLKEKVAEIKVRSAGEEERKAPMAVVSLSRGGKTRALLELTKELRSQGIVAIYVSFNDSTQLPPLSKNNSNTSPYHLRNELLRRITFELRLPQEQLLKFRKCGWDERLPEIIESYQGSVVLLIDELNNAIPQTVGGDAPEFYVTQQRELWDFIKQYFLVKNRLLIFSAHENQTVVCVTRDFIPTSNSLRKVTVERAPRITTQEEVKIITRKVGCTLPTMVCSGFLPAHIIDYNLHSSSEVDPIVSPVKPFAEACMRGQGIGLPYDVRRRSIYFLELAETQPECEEGQPQAEQEVAAVSTEMSSQEQKVAVVSTEMSSQEQKVAVVSTEMSSQEQDVAVVSTEMSSQLKVLPWFYWTPLWIARLLCCHKQTGNHFSQLPMAVNDKTNQKGDAWEVLIVLALILRRLTGTPMFMTDHNSSVENLGFFRPADHIKNVEGLRQWLESKRSKVDLAGLNHVVLLPNFPRFQQYDVLEAHLMEDNTWKLISGYQAKSGEGSIKFEAEIQGASWWLSLDARNRRNKPIVKGFVNLNDNEVQKFLGFSLWECAKHLKEFRNGKLHMSSSAAAAAAAAPH